MKEDENGKESRKNKKISKHKRIIKKYLKNYKLNRIVFRYKKRKPKHGY